MTVYERGSVVLVPFPFTDLSTVKRRPALVVSARHYNERTDDVIIAQITSRINAPPRPGDHKLARWREAGLLAPSLVRAKLTTVHSSLIARTLGSMPEAEMGPIDRALASALGLS
jgi:mRNA interferase MazF